MCRASGSGSGFHFKGKIFSACEMDIEHTFPGLDVLLLKAFAPSICVLSMEITAKFQIFPFVQNITELHNRAAH